MFGGIGGNGEVKNLQLVDVDYDVKQTGASGGIAMSNYGTITACSVTGTIAIANGGVGGIATSNIGTITACWFNGTLSGQDAMGGPSFGGIAAYNYGTVSACCWGGNATVGVYNNSGGTADTYQIDSGASWQPAVDAMNAALQYSEWRYELTDGLPVLQKKQ